MTTALERARAALNMLTPDELKTLQDEAGKLMLAYAAGGVLSGRGHLEVKTINSRYFDKELEEIVIVPHYYAYVRRAQIDDAGRVKLVNVGYYGKGGVEAISAGLGEALLDAHNAGGEDEGDSFLIQHGYEPPTRRQIVNKPPLDAPVHPLGEARLTVEELDASPIYHAYKDACPIPADELRRAVATYWNDLRAYEYAERENLRYRLDADVIEQRRNRAKRRDTAQPPRRMSRPRRRKE